MADAKDDHPEYRGWRSTKLHLALITEALITAAYAAMGFPQMLFDAYCMALLTAASIFTAPALYENIKRLGQPKPTDPPPPPPAAP